MAATATKDGGPVAAIDMRVGLLLVFLSALCWSVGGTIARFVTIEDNWTVVFWRSGFAAAFLVAFMLWRDGLAGTARLFRDMGVPGLVVAGCFSFAASSFVIALSYTTVANVVLIQAGVPLLAALLSWIVFSERVSTATWIAIAAVIAGVGIMVSESFGGAVSPIGDGLAVLIAIVFAIATVVTSRYKHVRMIPATCVGCALSAAFAGMQSSGLAVTMPELGLLFVFGAINLGLGFAFFAMGTRQVPAVYAALIGTFEPLLAPVWVWLIHDEVPSLRAVAGGVIIFVALLTHIGLEFGRRRAPGRPAVGGVQ
jgi:drug/metabolite transporter (DMT)-like permease